VFHVSILQIKKLRNLSCSQGYVDFLTPKSSNFSVILHNSIMLEVRTTSVGNSYVIDTLHIF